jgi:hypothetical protein
MPASQLAAAAAIVPRMKGGGAEHIGYIIDKNLMELASKKIKRRLAFSAEAAAELAAFHQKVLENLKTVDLALRIPAPCAAQLLPLHRRMCSCACKLFTHETTRPSGSNYR